MGDLIDIRHRLRKTPAFDFDQLDISLSENTQYVKIEMRGNNDNGTTSSEILVPADFFERTGQLKEKRDEHRGR